MIFVNGAMIFSGLTFMFLSGIILGWFYSKKLSNKEFIIVIIGFIIIEIINNILNFFNKISLTYK